MKTRVHLEIYGRVQGVFYRANTERQAKRLGLTGWVRNRLDGSVEAVAEGETDAVETLIAWCRQGPPRSQVDRLEIEKNDPTGEFKDFEIRY